jgi:hypothetical protein
MNRNHLTKQKVIPINLRTSDKSSTILFNRHIHQNRYPLLKKAFPCVGFLFSIVIYPIYQQAYGVVGVRYR